MLGGISGTVLMKLQVFPNPILKQVCGPVLWDRNSDGLFLSDLHDADFIRVAHKGAAIAAPQVGLAERWWVQGGGDGPPFALINPEVIPVRADGQSVMLEGCLSLPGHYSKVKRWNRVRVTGLMIPLSANSEPVSIDEEWVGVDAQIAQHENDHLVGILYTQLIPSAERSRIQGAVRKDRINGKI